MMLRRFAWGLGGLALLVLAALAAMIRIVPAPSSPPQAAAVGTTAAGEAQSSGALTVPVAGVPRSRITDTWGQSRASGARAHQGTDIVAPAGAPVVAAAPGTIEKLFYSQGGGGITLYERSLDGAWSYYYAHLQGYAPGLAEGMRVRAGDLLGYVGDTGNSGTGNFHLHFGVARMAPGERWWKGQAVNPYPLLIGGR